MHNPGLLHAACFCLVYLPCIESAEPAGRLLLLLLDGFRYDYLHQPGLPLPGFHRVAELGARANGLVPAFPSLSFPNYYSILTGLYTESHGQTGNYMYDVTRNESFLIGANPEHLHSHWWDGGDPLWATAVRQGKKVHMYHWPSCDVEVDGLRPSFCLQYSGVPTVLDLTSAINNSLRLFAQGTLDVSAIYFELTDSVGHKFGPFSTELNQVLLDLDPIISDLCAQLRQAALSDVNLLIVSDHGMTQTDPERTINISAVLQPSEYTVMLDAYAIISIYTSPGQEQQVYGKLVSFHPNMTVYLKSDLPERWHYKNGRYVAPITVVADNGWLIITPSVQNKTTLYHGFHGYDPRNRDMQGIFLAMGPAFERGASVQTLQVVDLYNVMCRILNIRPSPNNGSLLDVAPLLVSTAGTSGCSPTSAATLGLCLVLCVLSTLARPLKLSYPKM